MAFMHGWKFLFLHQKENGELVQTAELDPSLPLASVDDLFKNKELQVEKIYIVAKQGVYSYSSMNNTWYKSN